MKWCDCYSKIEVPSLESIAKYINNPLWENVRSHLEETYKVSPKVEYSTCSGAPGWNVKYKKSGRALCTLYPDEGFFTCLVCIGSREQVEAEILLSFCTEYLRNLYWSVKPFNGSRWLMIRVTSSDILEDVKRLIALRVQK